MWKNSSNKKHQRANSRYIQAEKSRVTGKELSSGADKALNRKEVGKGQRFFTRVFDVNLIDKLITSFLINAMAACVWLLFLWIAVRIILR